MVRPAQRREAVGYLVEQRFCSERRASQLLSISRSVIRYRRKDGGDERLRKRLKELAGQYPRYGYQLLHPLLKREGLVVNRKKTYRIYTEEKLQVKRRKRKRLPRQSRLELQEATRPNERWSMDFMSDQLADSRRFRILNLVDEYTRECKGQIVDFSISGGRLARFLDNCVQLPDEIVVDNGPEFTSKGHVSLGPGDSSLASLYPARQAHPECLCRELQWTVPGYLFKRVLVCYPRRCPKDD